jgi:FtsP/CotA-like multicopper oxidase with cupredoxin domain
MAEFADCSDRYHAHSELQRADGLYGAFVIHEPVDPDSFDQEYEKDMLLLIGDWYHRPAFKVWDYYTDWTNFGVEVSLHHFKQYSAKQRA